jgi:hypothetical protein
MWQPIAHYIPLALVTRLSHTLLSFSLSRAGISHLPAQPGPFVRNGLPTQDVFACTPVESALFVSPASKSLTDDLSQYHFPTGRLSVETYLQVTYVSITFPPVAYQFAAFRQIIP